jgi:hypothetical protein
MICPAYQSAYIYDKEALKKKFSYFKEDSTPKLIASTSKTKYLVAVPESYRKKMRSMATVEMKPVYPEIPDSLKMEEGAELLLAEREFVDSAAAVGSEVIQPGDSAYAITKAKEKFNVDQDNYMWYFRDMLVLPDVRAALMGKEANKSRGEEAATKKGIGGFFKNLFRKKPPKDSTAVDSATLPASDSTSTEKKGFLKKLFGKKKSKPKQSTEENKDPAKKEEGDEGFE